MKRLLNVDEEWLAGNQNCPPQGNLGGGVDEVVERQRGKLSLLSPFPNLQVCGGRGWNPSILSMEQQVLEEG